MCLVAQIRAIQARGLLNYLARQAQAKSLSLIDALNSAQDEQLTPAFRSGRVFTSTSGNGQSASFQIPQLYTADYTPTKIAEQLQEFIEIYNDCLSFGLFVATDDLTTVQLPAMLADDRLQTVDCRRLDITNIRFPVVGNTQ